MVIAAGDGKLAHLEADPRCVLVVFETAPPFRGIEVRADGVLSSGGLAAARLAIASRYLGEDRGRRFAEQRGDRGVVLRLPLAKARAWDLSSSLPPEEASAADSPEDERGVQAAEPEGRREHMPIGPLAAVPHQPRQVGKRLGIWIDEID